ncbi:DET1- and DDB1-associated protein 1-like [Metopolophium dirhodum]|uniref:DET1- and DDB1-associated protein 1-like n=1 Tax=Metopolophium dirhodum TaxID=44670 RepID=UPI0029901F55|nr:DET1- and DDB1-associated protein 1-like [Metopolophium dirhodum]
MSIAEFLDGLPSYDKRNFSRFISKSCEKFPVFITTKEIVPEQIIMNINSMYAPVPYLNIEWDRKKRVLTETSEGSAQHLENIFE